MEDDFIIFEDVFDKAYMRWLRELMQKAVDNYDISKMANPQVQTPLLNFGSLGDDISFDAFSDDFIERMKGKIMELFDNNPCVLLEMYHSIRIVSKECRRITGIHYDFQVSNALHHAVHKPAKAYTVWVPAIDVDETIPGLIVFDSSLGLKDIHKAAGVEGYIKNISYISCSDNNKRFASDPKYKKYLREEDDMHIVDILADFNIDEGRTEDMLELYASCMKNIYRNLEGRYRITTMKAGDVLFFNSNCYHGTYYPGKNFSPRMNIDFRIISDYADNEETDIFCGKRISVDDGKITVQPKIPEIKNDKLSA